MNGYTAVSTDAISASTKWADPRSSYGAAFGISLAPKFDPEAEETKRQIKEFEQKF